jgi:hypothetical protein
MNDTIDTGVCPECFDLVLNCSCGQEEKDEKILAEQDAAEAYPEKDALVFIADLHLYRCAAADLKAQLKTRVDEFEAQEGVKLLREKIKEANAAIDTLEEIVKTAGLVTYAVTENKKPFPGVEIKTFKVAKITDEPRAFSYALDNLPKALKLDTKYLEEYAKKTEGMVDLDFVEIKDEPRAQIAKDLAKHLS